MPIELPETSKEIEERSKTDVRQDLPGSNPFLKNSAIGALVSSNANRVFDFYGQLDLLQVLLMPDTAKDEFLERWAAIFGIQRLAATKSTGNIIISGTVSTSIPSGTTLTASNGELYDTTSTVNITAKNVSVTSINRSGSVATVVTDTDHNLSTVTPFTISGASPSDYNVVDQLPLQIVDETTFTFEISGTPSTPATGTIELDNDSAILPIESQNFQDSENGINVNLESGTVLTLQSPIVGVNNDGGVGAVAIGGGSDQETNTRLRSRFLNRLQNPVAHFSESDIINKALEVAGVTRVFVQSVTPAVGQVTVYFMRDNDSSPIPDAGEITTVKDKILEIKPANTADADVIVSAPTAETVDFTFTSLSPDTTTMRTSITANLRQFFDEQTDVGEDINENAYLSAIQNTIDLETGDRVVSFALSTPSGNVSIASSEIGVLGTVTYP